jgi:hypothetical protein
MSGARFKVWASLLGVLALSAGAAGSVGAAPKVKAPTATILSVAQTGHYAVSDVFPISACTFSVDYVVSGVSGKPSASYIVELRLIDPYTGNYTNGDIGTATKQTNGVTQQFATVEGDGWGPLDGSTWNFQLYIFKPTRSDRQLVSTSAVQPISFLCADIV